MIGQRGLFTLVLGENTVDDYANMQAQMTMGMQGDVGKAFTMERENLDLVRLPPGHSPSLRVQGAPSNASDPSTGLCPTAARCSVGCLSENKRDRSHMREDPRWLRTPWLLATRILWCPLGLKEGQEVG